MPQIPHIRVIIEKGDSDRKEFTFQKSFRIGRDEQCDICIDNNLISRFHVEVFLKQERWWIKDLGSSNGTFFNGMRIDELPLEKSKTVELGIGAVVLSLYPEEISPQKITQQERVPSLTQFANHYFGDTDEQNVGDHTRMIRKAFQVVQKKSKFKYIRIISTVLLLFGLSVIISGIIIYQKHKQIQRQQVIAEELFYTIKELELKLADLQKRAVLTQDVTTLQNVKNDRKQQHEMQQNYNKFLKELHTYDENSLGKEDSLILSISRIFGECELAIPEDYIKELKKYIKTWKTSNRLEKAIERAKQHGYIEKITSTMLSHDLPPQFFYLALQESDFLSQRVGPPTNYGIAKGIWQFIPSTALRYGLHTGPLIEIEKYDPRDERFNFEKATQAAARYIKDIYETDAQASGLLVIASYNWGERRVAHLIQKMPQDPRERNFWLLFKKYRKQFPQQTYDYIFMIVSAAVIGENPQQFGFHFENPLSSAVSKYFESKPEALQD